MGKIPLSLVKGKNPSIRFFILSCSKRSHMNLKKNHHSNANGALEGTYNSIDCGFLYFNFTITQENKMQQLDKLGRSERIDNMRGANIHRLI